MDNDLPSDFDVVVLGTGLQECIIAAAAARIGLTVLHMDREDFYGSDWGTFNFDGILKWAEARQDAGIELTDEEFRTLELCEGENLIKVDPQRGRTNCSNICHQFNDEIYRASSHTSQGGVTVGITVQDLPSTSESVSVQTVAESEIDLSEWTLQKIKDQWRRFNLDLSPKLLYSRGKLVDLLISSNVARYAEFKAVSRVLTYLNGRLGLVPCSRADIFSTSNVSIVEKRLLMKLLNVCVNEEHHQEIQGFENRSFLEFLKSRKLTPNLIHYTLHAIAMVKADVSTLEGVSAVQRFLHSLGRYGNTPFLWSIYGSGEIPQCFCRLCAVYGGTYYLKRSVEGFIFDSETNRCKAVVSNGRRINLKTLIMNATFADSSFLPSNYNLKTLSRGIFLTDCSLVPADKEQLTLLRLTPTDSFPNSITVLELGPSSMACPSGLFVVHMTCDSHHGSAKEDLQEAVETLFKRKYCDEGSKPRLIWAMYFNQIDSSSLGEVLVNGGQLGCPNVAMTSSPSSELDSDSAVQQARAVFERLFPDQEFLPRAPDPEEIVLDEPNNPGEHPELQETNMAAGDSATETEKPPVEEIETKIDLGTPADQNSIKDGGDVGENNQSKVEPFQPESKDELTAEPGGVSNVECSQIGIQTPSSIN